MARQHEHPDQKELSQGVGNYVVGPEIGHGSFATVYKGYHKTTREVVAIKSVVLLKLNRKLLENLESEISILKKMRHNHIVHLVDCQKSETHIHLIMEYCSMGDLSSYIKRRRDVSGSGAVSHTRSNTPIGLSEHVVRHFLKQLANALGFLRSANLIHRDIKPQNLLLQPPSPNPDSTLIGSPDLPILKIADFGFARFLPNASLAETLCGSPLYMAPEILRYEKYDAKADLWSVGAVLYEMATGRPPFKAQNHIDLLKKIELGEDDIKFPGDSPATYNVGSTDGASKASLKGKVSAQPAISEELKDLIRHVLKQNPVERISFEEFFMHPCVLGDIYPRQTGSSRIKQSEHRNPLPATDKSSRHVRDRSVSSPALVGCQNESEKKEKEKVPAGGKNGRIRDNGGKGLTALGGAIGKKVTHRHQQNPPGTNNYHSQNSPTDRLSSSPRHLVEMQRSSYNRSPSPSFLVQQTSQNIDFPRRRTYSDSISTGSHGVNGERNGNVINGGNNIDQTDDSCLRRRDEEIAFEREYVVIDPSQIDVNAFADELVASPKTNPIGIRRNRKHSSSSSGSSTPHTQGYPIFDFHNRHAQPISTNTTYLSTTPPFAISNGSEKLESAGSSGSGALAEALSIAGKRLFGGSNSPPKFGYKEAKRKSNAIMLPDEDIDPKEEAIVKIIQDAANKAYVVYRFADSKFHQLLPPLPTASSITLAESPVTSPEVTAVLAEEALALYLRALSILQSAMNTAKEHWNGLPEYSGHKTVSHKFNMAVQWVRARFNECLERAEYAKSKCRTDDENTAEVFPEKLLYDKALEMSRSAAVIELVGEDLTTCERTYQNAIFMLCAILDCQDDEEGMDEEDKQILNKLIISIQNRLVSLQKKLSQPAHDETLAA
ncbi:5553_t:CDS:10 [Paraglomus occultum]|uniref:non-specific serine/threonine protein kinase n=1 Tax=Paraglomus occultum TaxID=144539 RepID=A0A9N9G052_9GLOM|nr:5553_t:CDS:10 [Paraglomus occultum]